MRAGETLREGVSLDSCRHAHATAVEALMCKWMGSLEKEYPRNLAQDLRCELLASCCVRGLIHGLEYVRCLGPPRVGPRDWGTPGSGHGPGGVGIRPPKKKALQKAQVLVRESLLQGGVVVP